MSTDYRSFFHNDASTVFEIKAWDWILIIGSVLAPMTGFRVGKIGPAELLCFIWALRYLTPRIIFNDVTKFFGVFFVSMAIGTVICMIVAPRELVMNSWLSWIFLSFIACTLFDVIDKNDVSYNEKVFDLICHLSVGWYLFLYLYTMTTGQRTFLGAPLWYYSRFSGGGKNPHQLATMFCGIVFWFLRQFKMRKSIVLNLACFFTSISLISATQSSTGTAAVFMGIMAFLFILTISSVRDYRLRINLMIIEIVVVFLVMLLFNSILYTRIYEWVASDKNGLGRFYLWASIKQMAVKSPIFGLGPGVHAISRGGYVKEFHNSYIELYAASGILGIAALIMFSAKYLKKIFFGDVFFFPIMASMYMYSVAGFAFRRLAFWVVVSFTYTIASQYMRENAITE